MLPKKMVYLGLFAFLTLTVGSLAIVVSGSIWPSRAAMVALGDPVPDFALPTLDGVIFEVHAMRDRGLVLVCPPAGTLSIAQERAIRDLTRKAVTATPTQRIGVLPRAMHGEDKSIVDDCDVILVDEYRTLWPITGSDAASASVCIVDAQGRLQARWVIPPENSAAEDAPIQPDTALADSRSPANR